MRKVRKEEGERRELEEGNEARKRMGTENKNREERKKGLIGGNRRGEVSRGTTIVGFPVCHESFRSTVHKIDISS
jgi:hypothetical protein